MLLQVFSCSSEELKNRRANWRSSALVSFYQGSPPRRTKILSAESATEADSALQKTDRVACALILILPPVSTVKLLIVPPVPTVKRMGSLPTEHAI